MLININPDNPQLRLIQQVVEHLQAGAIICYPTDTGYGVGCDLFHQKAIKRLMQIKKRPEGKPFSFMCSSLTNISEYAHVSNTAYRLMKKICRGPIPLSCPEPSLFPRSWRQSRKPLVSGFQPILSVCCFLKLLAILLSTPVSRWKVNILCRLRPMKSRCFLETGSRSLSTVARSIQIHRRSLI